MYYFSYKTDDGPPLPTVLLNTSAENQLKSIRITRGTTGFTSGVFQLPPDYSNKMTLKPNRTFQSSLPRNDFELQVYSSHWKAGVQHCDYDNVEGKKYQNRFLLFGRPQLGKTSKTNLLTLIFFISF